MNAVRTSHLCFNISNLNIFTARSGLPRLHMNAFFNWLKRVRNKESTLQVIATEETTNKNRTAHDSFAQHGIRDRMERLGYKYIGNPGKADAANSEAYKS